MTVNAGQLGDALVEHYNRRLAEHGDTAQGACWPNDEDRRTRYGVMLDLIETTPDTNIVLCDLGCGTAELLAYIRESGLKNIDYFGVDYSAPALSLARAKFPGTSFIQLNIADPGADWASISCDYLVVNGVFTGKFDVSHEDMWSLLITTVENAWPHIRRGLAFNVMSKVVDWERDDLFHLPMDEAARLLHRVAGRNVRMRADYGLYEYTAYAYRRSAAREAARPAPRLSTEPIPVLRPLLPRCDELIPYLRRIDATRIYTNHGPLLSELEARMAEHFELPADSVACASSGTLALVGAILAAAGRASLQKPLALIPAFTFPATALAAEQCGYQPYLADIDPETWSLDPERLVAHSMLRQIGVVVPVAPFGRPIPLDAWLEFRARTGIPVVIDAAASFDRIFEDPSRYIGALPLTLSFHATKSFSTGCGGAVIATDRDLVTRAVQAMNFGFLHDRQSRSSGTNGKMSEYHAAVGLAELDGWDRKVGALRCVIDSYRSNLAKAGLAEHFVGAPDVSLAYAIFRCNTPEETTRVRVGLLQHGIDTRLWYSFGLQKQPYFSRLPHDVLAVTDSLASCLVGLPLAPDLQVSDVVRVTATLASLARGRQAHDR